MELHASGFSAWNQLRFSNPGSQESADDEPDDLSSFACVLRDEIVHQPRSFLSYTVVRTASGTRVAGSPPQRHERLRRADPAAYSKFAEAANDVVAIYDTQGQITEYPNVEALLSGKPGTPFPGLPPTVQLVAYQTGFAALSSTGHVWTWGDARYSACLGREVSASSPADRPGLVGALEDLPTGPVTKLAAGGYLLAALTKGNDLYCWGGHPGQQPVLEDVDGEPSPVVVGDNDAIDVDIGDSHLILLTEQREVFVTGRGDNGQLGLGPATVSVDSWTRLPLHHLGEGNVPFGVAAGPKTSFILVTRTENEPDVL